MNNSEVAILILAGDAKKYQMFIDIITNNWYQKAIKSGFKVFFYSGGHEKNYIHNNIEIRVSEDDEISNCYKKFIAAKNILKQNYPEVKLIYRTNVTSYIDIDNFNKYLIKANFTKNSIHGIKGNVYKYSELFYGNKILHLIFKYLRIGPKIEFYSGAGLFIGMDLCDNLSYNKSKKYMIDDVEIGYQIKHFVVHDLKYERVYITDTFKKIQKDEYFKMLNQEFLFHYKFKTSDRSNDSNLLQKFDDPQFRISYLTI